jgi:hypothetical protein
MSWTDSVLQVNAMVGKLHAKRDAELTSPSTVPTTTPYLSQPAPLAGHILALIQQDRSSESGAQTWTELTQGPATSGGGRHSHSKRALISRSSSAGRPLPSAGP